jgi:hypothetical protein
MLAESRRPDRKRSRVGAVSLLAFVSFAPMAGGQEPTAASESDLAETAAKLSNPLSDVWALFSRFDLHFADGDVNSGDSKIGSRMLFQPILPVPLYGEGANKWNLIMRPTIPVLFSEPVPTGLDTFDRKEGLGDIQLPTVIAPPTGNWILGAGPAFLFPAATDDAFGRRQWGVGPAAVVGYRTERATFGALAQYYFGVGSRGTREPGVPDASYMNLLYFAYATCQTPGSSASARPSPTTPGPAPGTSGTCPSASWSARPRGSAIDPSSSISVSSTRL